MNLIERQDALRLFDELVQATSSGHGGVVLVKGATAIGKSALLHAFRRRGPDRGAVVLAATASRAERDVPFGVLWQLIHAAAHAGGGRAPIASPTAAPAPGPAGAGFASRPAAQVELPALEAMCAPLVELSADHPLVISVDDIEYADAASLQALMFLSRRLHFVRIAIVLSHTDPGGCADNETIADLARQPHCHTIHLEPLSRKGVRALACGLVGREAGRRLHLSWLRLSGGNPLLVTALGQDYQNHLRAMEDNRAGAAPMVGARYGQAIVACLRRGGEQILRVAQGLAVLGGEEGLDDLLGLPGAQLARGLHALAAAGLTAGGSFRDEAARGAVLADMSDAEQMRLHGAAAELLYGLGRPTGVVAEHLVRAGRLAGGDWSVAALEDAAARALCEGRAERAIAYLRQARFGCTDEKRRNELTVKLVRAEWRINPAVPADRLAELTDAARRGSMTGPSGVTLVRALLWHGRSVQAREVLDLVIQSGLTQAGTAHELIVLRDWMRCTHPLDLDLRLRDLPAGRENGATTPVAAVRRLDAAKLLAHVLTDTGRDDVPARAEPILRGCRADDTSFDAIVWTLKALTYGDCLEQAQTWCDAVHAEVTAQREPQWSARLAGIRSEIALRQGDMPLAERHARTALELVPPAGWGVAIGEPLSTLILACTAMGQHQTAAEQLGLPVPEAMFKTRFGLQYLRARGRHSLAAGNPALALHDFRLCGELMSTWRMDAPTFLPWRADAAEAWLQLGRPDEARPLVEAQLARCGPMSTRAQGRTVRLLAATREPHQRAALLQRATDLSQAGGDRYEMALALQDLADAHRNLGAHRRAATIARRARMMAPEFDAPPLATPMPAATGAQEADLSDLARYAAALSDAERRVAVLAALGYSNRDIAEKLWITVSTVEQHLTRAYRKLDVTRRSDLPAGLQAFC